ncbi:MAG: PAS domain S-box protein [Deltaproteobacteria bacterium]|nr:PAS domain S-box protein [Deltaproteobacteria bacterium]
MRRTVWMFLVFLLLVFTLWWAILAHHGQRQHQVLAAWNQTQSQVARATARAVVNHLQERVQVHQSILSQEAPLAFRSLVSPGILCAATRALLLSPDTYWILPPDASLGGSGLPPAQAFRLLEAAGARNLQMLEKARVQLGCGEGQVHWTTARGPERAAWCSFRVMGRNFTLVFTTPETAIWEENGVAAAFRREIMGGVIISLLLTGLFWLVARQQSRDQELLRTLEETVNLRTSQLSELNDTLLIRLEELERTKTLVEDSEEKYRRLFDLESDAIFMAETQDGRILEANAAASQLFGYPRHELRDLRLRDLAQEPETAGLLLDPGQDCSRFFYQKSRDGRRFPAGVSRSFFVWRGHPVVVAAYRDMSEWLTAREEVERQRKFLQEVIDFLPNLLSVKDHEGRFVLVNQALVQMLGGTREEILGHTLVDLVPGEASVTLLHQAELALLEGTDGPLQQDFRLPRSDGGVRWLQHVCLPLKNASGQVDRLLSVSNDITRLKEMQEALADSEELFRTLAETTASGILIVQGDQFQYLNPAGQALLGRDLAEVRKLKFWEVVHPRFQTLARERGLARMRGEDVPAHYELLVVNPQRGELWVDYTATQIMYRGAPAMLGTAFDITQRKLAEEALFHSEARYRTILDNIEEGYYELDLAGNLTFVNDSLCRISRFSREELLGLPFRRLMAPHQARHALVVARQVHETGRPIRSLELRVIRGDGAPAVMEVSISPMSAEPGHNEGLRGIVRDVTERRWAQERLQESEARLRAVLNANPDPVIIRDTAGRVTYFNPAFERVFGWYLPEWLGRPLEGFVPPENHEEAVHLERQVAAGRWFTGLETVRLSRDGRRIPVSASGASFTDAQGRSQGSIINFRDTSEQKALEEKLLQSQKMQAIGTLASGIAHDFNNILQAVSGYVQLLLGRDDLPAKAKSYLEDSDLSLERASNLVQQLLTFGRKVTPSLGPVDLNREVTQTVRVLRRTIPRMIEIKTSLDPNLAQISGDPNQLDQIILNLASNARDAIAEEGQMVLSTRNLRLPFGAPPPDPGLTPGDWAVLEIRDNGAGMAPETLEHIYEPFFTTKNVGQGTGLGLSSVYGIVQSHKGLIACESELGQGASFRIYFPALPAAVPLPADSSQPEPAPRPGRETLLLVDDEPNILDIAQDFLAGHGYRVFLATSGEEALEIYRERAAEIDLVMLDLGMPGMGGRRCLEELVKLDPGVKVVVASGYGLTGLQKDHLADQALGFLAKPYRLGELLEVIQHALG